MNLLERTFKEYLEIFHSTLSQTAEEFLPTKKKNKLLHLSFLPAQIVGYVSTKFGIGFEYIPAKETGIKIVIGGASVEELFVKFPKNLPNPRYRFGIGGMNNLISDLTIVTKNNLPFKLIKEPSSVSIKDVGFNTGLIKKVVTYAEFYSNRDVEYWSRENAIERAKDEVLAALVEINRSQAKGISLDEYISAYKEKTVLLLGDYDESGLERLQLIQNILKNFGYEPLLIKDIPDHPHQDLSQKVIAIGAISRLIVIDDSSKSGHLTEIEICKKNNWVTILLRADGIGGTWMTAGASEFSRVILEKNYSPNAPEKDIFEATLWAEERIKELEKRFSDIYPWRKTVEE